LSHQCECCRERRGVRWRRRAATFLLASAVGTPGISGIWTQTALASTVDTEIQSFLVNNAKVNAKPGSQVMVTHFTLEPGEDTGWHYTSGPHFVLVRTGTLQIFSTDCSVQTFPTSAAWFDNGGDRHPFIHDGFNPGPDSTELIFVDFRKPGDPLFKVPADPPPLCT
jgi:hypothetical protein